MRRKQAAMRSLAKRAMRAAMLRRQLLRPRIGPIGAQDAPLSSGAMKRIVVVADVPWVRNEVHASLTAPDYELIDLEDPTNTAAVALDERADAVVVDLQVGSMGGMAVTRDVRDKAKRTGHGDLPVVMLLDRSADGFLAKRAGAAAWLVKPFTAHEIRTALAGALGDGAAVDAPGGD